MGRLWRARSCETAACSRRKGEGGGEGAGERREGESRRRIATAPAETGAAAAAAASEAWLVTGVALSTVTAAAEVAGPPGEAGGKSAEVGAAAG